MAPGFPSRFTLPVLGDVHAPQVPAIPSPSCVARDSDPGSPAALCPGVLPSPGRAPPEYAPAPGLRVYADVPPQPVQPEVRIKAAVMRLRSNQGAEPTTFVHDPYRAVPECATTAAEANHCLTVPIPMGNFMRGHKAHNPYSWGADMMHDWSLDRRGL